MAKVKLTLIFYLHAYLVSVPKNCGPSRLLQHHATPGELPFSSEAGTVLLCKIAKPAGPQIINCATRASIIYYINKLSYIQVHNRHLNWLAVILDQQHDKEYIQAQTEHITYIY